MKHSILLASASAAVLLLVHAATAQVPSPEDSDYVASPSSASTSHEVVTVGNVNGSMFRGMSGHANTMTGSAHDDCRHEYDHIWDDYCNEGGCNDGCDQCGSRFGGFGSRFSLGNACRCGIANCGGCARGMSYVRAPRSCGCASHGGIGLGHYGILSQGHGSGCGCSSCCGHNGFLDRLRTFDPFVLFDNLPWDRPYGCSRCAGYSMQQCGTPVYGSGGPGMVPSGEMESSPIPADSPSSEPPSPSEPPPPSDGEIPTNDLPPTLSKWRAPGLSAADDGKNTITLNVPDQNERGPSSDSKPLAERIRSLLSFE